MQVIYTLMAQELFGFSVIVSVLIVAFAGSFALALRLNGMLGSTGTEEIRFDFYINDTLFRTR